MPTIIALDVSLSMQRTIPGRSETYHQLALKGISQLIDHLSATSKLEYIALITFSTFSEVKVDFTRDYDQVRSAVRKVEAGDKLCLESMLKSVSGILSTNWGTQNYCQVVVFTDCGLGFGSTALKGFLAGYVGKEQDPVYAWIASLKAVKLNFVCMGLHSDYYFTRAIPLYQQLLDLTGLKGQLYMTKPHKDPAALDSGESSTDNAASKNSSSNNSTLSSSNSTPSGSATGGSGHSSHKSELGRTAMFELIERLCEANFKPYEATLKCGGYFRLECPILIWPPPVPYHSESGGVKTQHTISPKIEVCGYLALSEIGSPASLSRHLIIPKVDREKPSRRGSDKSGSSSKSTSSSSANVKTAPPALDVNQPNYEYEKLEQDIKDFYTKDAKDTDESGEDGETNTGGGTGTGKSTSSAPTEVHQSMCVLLHGALKVENLAALVLLNENWYGFLYSYADSKKKSNLMMNILPPGSSVIPWLGDLQMLSFAEDLMPGETSAFPVKADKRSYSQSCVVWIRHVSLQSDIQKVLRHAKKMPEKTQHFYKELNRIRRAALSFGFVELLEAMATLFEKESAHLAVSSNPECSFQLKHAAIELRKPSNQDLKVVIAPVQKFGAADGGATSSSTFVY